MFHIFTMLKNLQSTVGQKHIQSLQYVSTPRVHVKACVEGSASGTDTLEALNVFSLLCEVQNHRKG